MLLDATLTLGAFALGAGIAALVGAVNFGTSLGVGQLAFAATLTYVLLRR